MTFYGLSEKDAEASRKKYGSNELLYRPSFGKSLLRGFGGLSCKLFAAAALAGVSAALLGLLGYGGISADFSYPIIFGILAVVCGFSETVICYRSEMLLNEICAEADCGICTVFRDDGKAVDIPENMLAVGDAVVLSAGDKVPADGAVMQGLLEVDQSVFGVLGRAEKTSPPEGVRRGNGSGVNDPYFLYGGSVVTSGSGIMKVTAVGLNTRLGRKQGVKPVTVPEDCFEKTAFIGGGVGVLAALAVLGYFLVTGGLWGAVRGISVAAAVLAVSCFCGKGLLCFVTAAGTEKRLAKKSAAVSDPSVLIKAAETGIVFVRKAALTAQGETGSIRFIDGGGKEYDRFGKLDKRLAELFARAVVCTSSAVAASGKVHGGNVLDKALYGFAGRSIEKVPEMKKQAEVRSDGENVLSGVTVSVGGKLFTFVRGGAEILLDRCSDSFGGDGKKQKINNKNALAKLAETLSMTSGSEVTAFALSERGISGGRLPSSGYTLIGLTALDLPVDGAAEQVKRLEKHGVRTVPVSPESKGTLAYTVKKAGIANGKSAKVISAEQLAKTDDKELDSVCAVSRAAPSDLRRLVRMAHGKGIRVCGAAKEADWTVSGSIGIKIIADIISASVKFSASCRGRLIARAVLAVLAAAFILISN